MVVMRIGVPLAGGALIKAARDLDAPVLISANAFRRDGKWRRFPEQLAGMSVALDSAGFVAMTRYNGYPWSRSEYLDLVEQGKWDWYATRDFCCEPQIAKYRADVAERIKATADEFHALANEANSRGLDSPMPVLQGWYPDEYQRCADLYGLHRWPDLVGIGSVCRRHMNGPEGVLRIVAALDKIMPQNVRFHLFGVKGTALTALRGHARIESADSMAWDFACRRENHRVNQTMRAEYMRRWYRGIIADLSQPDLSMSLFNERTT